jgi:hypothetical protein
MLRFSTKSKNQDKKSWDPVFTVSGRGFQRRKYDAYVREVVVIVGLQRKGGGINQ